jgi:hypothetical protein
MLYRYKKKYHANKELELVRKNNIGSCSEIRYLFSAAFLLLQGCSCSQAAAAA